MNLKEEYTTKPHTKLEIDLMRALELAIVALSRVTHFSNSFDNLREARNALDRIREYGFEV